MKIQRVRITFTKTEAMRFTSHLDLILTWERTFRRSGLPLSYSEGFNPRPVINLAAPLPLGFTSEGEIGDFWLSEAVPETTISTSLDKALPPGLGIRSIKVIPQIHGNKLPSIVESAIYQINLDKAIPELPSRINEILAAKSLIRTRKDKKYDLRPLIHTLTLFSQEESDNTNLETKLSLLPGATGRPEEVLSALGISSFETRICRQKILLKPDHAIT